MSTKTTPKVGIIYYKTYNFLLTSIFLIKQITTGLYSGWKRLNAWTKNTHNTRLVQSRSASTSTSISLWRRSNQVFTHFIDPSLIYHKIFLICKKVLYTTQIKSQSINSIFCWQRWLSISRSDFNNEWR